MSTRRDQLRWLALTLPIAALAALTYATSEWLFIVTRPSALASLPFATQVRVLTRAPLPLLWPLLGAQLVASLVSLVAFPRARAVAVVPGAVIGGALLLLLLDNFSYTLFGVGVLTTEGFVRVLYAAAFPGLIVVAGYRLFRWADALAALRPAPAAAALLGAVLAASPLLLVSSLAPVDAAAPPALASSGPSSRPNVLIIGIDGVDATSLSAYGYERDTSPYLRQLRDDSLFFENAFANVGRTHGSLVAMLTGRLPFSTHVTFPPTALQGADAHRHLPGLLKPLGYSTLQLGMRHYADAEDANLLGFDAANYRWQDLEHLEQRSGDDETAVFRRDVAERIDERVGHLFGLRHAIDVYAHVEGKKESPYWKDERRVETLTRYLPAAPEPWFVHTHFLDTHCCAYRPTVMTFSGGDPTRDALDSQLREADDHVRAVVESLRASGRLERTIIVITSDHTNGWTTRGRVPLLIRFPHAAITGRVRDNVQLVDIAPTLMDYLGQPTPAWMDGVSLLDESRRSQPRPIVAISEIEGRHSVGLMVTALDNAGPPNFGAGTVTLVSGPRWYELALADGRLTSGAIAGHTDPARPALDEAAAMAVLRATLERAGFVIHAPSH